MFFSFYFIDLKCDIACNRARIYVEWVAVHGGNDISIYVCLVLKWIFDRLVAHRASTHTTTMLAF